MSRVLFLTSTVFFHPRSISVAGGQKFGDKFREVASGGANRMATRTMAAVEEQPFACVGEVDWSDLLLFRRSITVNCQKYLLLTP